MRLRLTMTLLLTLATSGCVHLLFTDYGTPQYWARERRAWVEREGDGLTPRVAQAIREGRVIPGMTMREARAAWMRWTRPRRATVASHSVYGDREVYMYLYSDARSHRVMFIENGRVTSAHTGLTGDQVRVLRRR